MTISTSGSSSVGIDSLPIQKKHTLTTPEQAKKVSQDYEFRFLNYMLKDMFSSVESDWGEGHTGEMIKSFWIDAMAKVCSQKGFGIGKIIYKQLMKDNNLREGNGYDQQI